MVGNRIEDSWVDRVKWGDFGMTFAIPYVGGREVMGGG